MRYREMRNHFNGKTIESAVCSDLGNQTEFDHPAYIEFRFTDGSYARINATDYRALLLSDTQADPYDLAHMHSKGHPK